MCEMYLFVCKNNLNLQKYIKKINVDIKTKELPNATETFDKTRQKSENGEIFIKKNILNVKNSVNIFESRRNFVLCLKQENNLRISKLFITIFYTIAR